MIYLVTGATGFIGRVLVRQLLEKKHEIVILSRNKRKAEAQHSDNKIRTYLLNSSFKDSLERLPRVDGVFHLAANQKYLGPKSLLFNDNVVLTRRLLEWSARKGPSFFVYTSSIDAMGPAASIDQPLTENRVCRPLSRYGWSKYLAEKAIVERGKELSVRTVILRLGNVYGPGSNFIVPEIAQAIRQPEGNLLIKYYHQIRKQYVHLGYVEDIAAGILHAGLCYDGTGETFLLAGEEPATIEDLFRRISKIIDHTFTPPVDRLLPRIMAPLRDRRQWYLKRKADRVTYFRLGHWLASTEKARTVLGFIPAVALNEGIARTINPESLHDEQKSPANLSAEYARA